MGHENGIMLTERSKPKDALSKMEGTAQDKEDMWRVGRDQELNVRKSTRSLWIDPILPMANENNTAIEKLPVSVRSWLYSSAYVHLGSCPLVSED